MQTNGRHERPKDRIVLFHWNTDLHSLYNITNMRKILGKGPVSSILGNALVATGCAVQFGKCIPIRRTMQRCNEVGLISIIVNRKTTRYEV